MKNISLIKWLFAALRRLIIITSILMPALLFMPIITDWLPPQSESVGRLEPLWRHCCLAAIDAWQDHSPAEAGEILEKYPDSCEFAGLIPHANPLSGVTGRIPAALLLAAGVSALRKNKKPAALFLFFASALIPVISFFIISSSLNPYCLEGAASCKYGFSKIAGAMKKTNATAKEQRQFCANSSPNTAIILISAA